MLQDLALVCQHFHSLSKDEMLWKVICTRIGASNQNESGSWLHTFMAKSGKHHHPPHVVWAVLGHVDWYAPPPKQFLSKRRFLESISPS